MQVTTILPCPQPWRKLASLGHTGRAQQEMEKGQGPPLAHKPPHSSMPSSSPIPNPPPSSKAQLSAQHLPDIPNPFSEVFVTLKV